MGRKPAAIFNREKPGGVRQGRWGWGIPLKKRPPPGVTGVPRLVPVVKLLARVADLMILGLTGPDTRSITHWRGSRNSGGCEFLLQPPLDATGLKRSRLRSSRSVSHCARQRVVHTPPPQ